MAGNLESKIKSVRWACGRYLPNINHLNGEGKWHASPKGKIDSVKGSISVPIFNNICSFNIVRGPPSLIYNARTNLKSFLQKVTQYLSVGCIAIAFLLCATLLNPATASPKSSQKVIYINPFVQENDSNLVWYGSGDLDSNGVLNQTDLNLMGAGGDSSDQADTDGDGTPYTPTDFNILSNHLNNNELMPAQWTQSWQLPEEQGREFRTNWIEKTLAIDKGDEHPYIGGEYMCGQFARQAVINFKGFGKLNNPEIAEKFHERYDSRYSLKHNGRFNLPVYDVRVRGPPGHAINGILIGENPLDFDSWYFFDETSTHGGGDSQVTLDNLYLKNCIVKPYYTKMSTFYEGSVYSNPFIAWKVENRQASLDTSYFDGLGYKEGLVLTPPNTNNIVNKLNNKSFELNQNYPNPFNLQTSIKYSLDKKTNVDLSIYNLKGQKLETLVNSSQMPGNYKVGFDSKNYSSGIYFYRLKTGDKVKIKKMTVLK